MEKVLVFIPVKNEEKTVKKIVEEVASLYPSWDIVVIDDVSTDNTVKEAMMTKAKVVPLILNTRGVGTVLTAFMIAYRGKYDYLIKIDGDGQQEPSLLGKLVQALKGNDSDIAVGSRYLEKVQETDSFIKVVGRNFSSALINFKVRNKNKVTDCTSGIRAWNYRSINQLCEVYSKQPLAFDSVFWLKEAIIASRIGLKMCEIPAFYHKREHGKSKSFSHKNMFTFPFRLFIMMFS